MLHPRRRRDLERHEPDLTGRYSWNPPSRTLSPGRGWPEGPGEGGPAAGRHLTVSPSPGRCAVTLSGGRGHTNVGWVGSAQPTETNTGMVGCALTRPTTTRCALSRPRYRTYRIFMHPKVHEALSADIHLLGDLLGETIRRLAGEEAYALVEEVRAAAKELRADPSVEEARRLRDRLGRLDLPALRALIRAFSVYFDLINLAEQQARVRALRRPGDRRGRRTAQAGDARGRAPAAPRARGSTPRRSPSTSSAPWSARSSPRTRARPGGGPSWRSSTAIAQQLDRIEDGRLVPAERDERRRGDRRGGRDALALRHDPRLRPTVLDEVRQGLGLVEGSLFDVVPRVYRKIEAGLAGSTPSGPGTSRRSSRSAPGSAATATATRTSPTGVTADAIRLQQETVLATTWTGWTTSGGGSATPTASSKPGPALRESLATRRRALPRGAPSRRARALPGQVPDDLGQAPPDPRRTSGRSSPDWAADEPRRRAGRLPRPPASCSTTSG